MRLISDNNVIEYCRVCQVGRTKSVFHRLDCFPDLSCIRTTGGVFLLKVGDFGIPDCLIGFIPALPKGKPVDWRLGGTGKGCSFDGQASPSHARAGDCNGS